MTPIEKSKLIDELFSLRKADQELMGSERKRMETERKRLDDLLDSFQAVNVELRGLRVQFPELLNQLAVKDAEKCLSERGTEAEPQEEPAWLFVQEEGLGIT